MNGARSRPRNFSNWAYWQLRLAGTVHADPCPLGDLAVQFESWRARVEARVDHLLGPIPDDPVPLDVEVVTTVDCGPYRRDEIVFDTEPTMSVPAFLLVPHARVSPGPAVLAIHGHGAGKSMVCGIDDDDPAKRAEIDGYAGDYAHRLASAGYVVLAPDLRGFGARADWMPEDKYHCDRDLVCATMAGVNPLARNLWDLERALDLLSEHPLVDAEHLAVAGLSYGGTLALFLAAIDVRVRAAIVSGYLSSWEAAHRVPWNMCGSQVMPGQLGTIEHLDVACLVAPRALLVESGIDDLIFPVGAARVTVDALRRVYAHLDAPADALVHDVFHGGHRWHGTEVERFLVAHLGPVGDRRAP